MVKERLHYQKSFSQKVFSTVGDILFKNNVIKRAALFLFTYFSISVLFALSAYQHKTELNINTIYSIVFSCLLFLLLGVYLRAYYRTIYDSTRLLSVVTIIILIVLAVGLISEPISIYFIVVPSIIIAIALIYNMPIAIVSGVIAALIAGLLSSDTLIVFVLCLLGSMAAVYFISKRTERIFLIRTAFFLSFAMAIINLVISLSVGSNIEISIRRGMLGAASGLTSAVLAIGIMPFLEDLFGITTNFKLMELAQSNKDVLKKLLVKAPGTYNHSQNVANMVETIAPFINADPLVAKVGGLYHDIGKINRSYFFTENQFGKNNPHNKTKADVSYLIITSHVKDGVEIAKKNNMPEEIIDIIEQHHGSSVVNYFYRRAKKLNKKISEGDYRYHEKKPQTKEAALIMLADSVEAAAKSLKKPSAKKLKALVNDIVEEKINDNQLEECGLK